jgi:hypothetical protein
MDMDKIKKSIEKYIGAIIIPEFPDIMTFSVELIPIEWTDDKSLKIVFLMDGTEESEELEILDSVRVMFKMFSFHSIPRIIEFETS